MSSTRIPSSSNYVIQQPNPTTVQPGTGSTDPNSSSTSTSSSSAKSLPQVNIFDANARKAAAQALVALAQKSGSINLPEDTSSTDSDSSDDSDDGGSFAGSSALPPALQQVPPAEYEKLNAAAGNIATAVFATPLSQLQAYNAQFSSASNTPAAASSSVTSKAMSGLGTNLSQATSGLSSSGGVSVTSSGLDSTNGGVVSTQQTAPTLSTAIAQANSSFGQALSAGNYDQSITAVGMAGVLSLQQQLGSYATYVQTNQNNQNMISTDASELTQALAEWPSTASTQTFTWHEINDAGQITTSTASLTQAQAQALQTTLQDQATSMSDQSQTDQLKLQSMAQQYQEGLTTVSNMLSMFYNTTKNTLNNIHY